MFNLASGTDKLLVVELTYRDPSFLSQYQTSLVRGQITHDTVGHAATGGSADNQYFGPHVGGQLRDRSDRYLEC